MPSLLEELNKDMLVVTSFCFLSVLYLRSEVLCDDSFLPRLQDTGEWNTSMVRNKRIVDSTESCAGAKKVGNLQFISSPNFPREYGYNTLCEWQESAPSGCTFEITFTDFDLEKDVDCEYDRVEVFDGSSSSAAQLGEFCGQTLPPTIHSSTNEIFLRFRSDGSSNYQGFKLFLQQICNSGETPTSTPGSEKQQYFCLDGYAEKDSKCEECFCGNDSSCVFHAGKKVCICNKGYAEKDGKCEECNCGNNSICVFKAGEKRCLCSEGYAQKDGKCEECNCGNKSSCAFEAGEKRCFCSKDYAVKNGKCVECHCETGYFCDFRTERKKCVAPQQLQKTGKTCKGFVSSIAAVSVACAVLLLGLIYVAIHYTRLRKRTENYGNADFDSSSGIRYSATRVPYRKEPL